MLIVFSCAFWPSVLEKCLFRSFTHFLMGLFVLIVNCMRCLYILEVNPLLVASLVNIFSQSVGCLFALFMVSFAVQKLLNLIRHNLFIFIFFITVGGGSRKILPWFMSKSFLPVFSSNSFVVSGFKFRSFF